MAFDTAAIVWPACVAWVSDILPIPSRLPLDSSRRQAEEDREPTSDVA
jgi:hypothetical protein